MAIFFVGLRVRIVDALAHPYLVGFETRITGVAYGPYAEAGYEWIIDVEGIPFGACSRHLEPILPEGHRPCDAEFKHDLDQLLEREGFTA